MTDPTTDLDPAFSDESATPVPWERAREQLELAEIFWLTTVRPDGRPHVTPLIALWQDGAMHFCTGPQERKAKNLEHNPSVVLTTGTSAYSEGTDLVIEGRAVRVTDAARLQSLAAGWERKYGKDWHFDVLDGAFTADGVRQAYVFEVAPVKAFGFSKGQPFGQTRWRF